MNATYDYDQLRAAVHTIRTSRNQNDRYDAANLLADYTEASLDYADEVDGFKAQP